MKKRKSKIWKMALLAEKALKEAVYEAFQDHARTGDPVAIWKNGRVVLVPAKQLLTRRNRNIS
ncbi:MAG: hypothetical protein HY447_02280 [Candidatus Omnitrophica bacterium]|nr:hypothetical protein [Candidatus Omnitrophota bacterium]